MLAADAPRWMGEWGYAPGGQNGMMPAPSAPSLYQQQSQVAPSAPGWSISFAPGTSEEQKKKAYDDLAARDAERRNRQAAEAQRAQDEIAEYRRRFPYATDAQISQAITMDRERARRESEDAWVEQYGAEWQKEGVRRRKQDEADYRNRQEQERSRRAQDQDVLRRAEDMGVVAKWNGNGWEIPQGQQPAMGGMASGPYRPGQAQPIQPSSQGTPYGVQMDLYGRTRQGDVTPWAAQNPSAMPQLPPGFIADRTGAAAPPTGQAASPWQGAVRAPGQSMSSQRSIGPTQYVGRGGQKMYAR